MEEEEEERGEKRERRNPSAQYSWVLSNELTENRLKKMLEILNVCFEDGVTYMDGACYVNSSKGPLKFHIRPSRC